MRRAVTDADKEFRRLQILEAAKRVFVTTGFHDASIAAVAREAGLSYGSVYSYFDSKRELYMALMDDGASSLRNAIAEAMASTPPSSIDTLRMAIAAVFEFFIADPGSAAVLFRDPPTQGGDFARHLAQINDRFVDELQAALEVAQARGDLRGDIPARTAALSLALVVGQLALRLVDGNNDDVTADHLVTLVMEGLLPR